MTLTEQREAARKFANKWQGRGREDEDARSYWIDILQNIFGMENLTDRVEFEKKVVGADGNTKRIDVYIPETRVMIEQKSLGIALDKPQAGHNGMTPYEQAKMYDNGLPVSEKARWIITSNFSEIWIYDMDTARPEAEVKKIMLAELPDRFTMLDFLMNKTVRKVTEEMELSLKAGELVGKIHDRFLEQYNDPMAKRTQNSLNILCVRLVFCLYAEDAGLFGPKDAFSSYIRQYEPKDIRQALLLLFKVLDTPYDERPDLYLSDELEAFPYCNGGLFANENIVIPKITQEIKDTLLDASIFDWSKISPTIFGAVFESTLNPETRRSGGMHYTSIENIHKVIDPLFLDDLTAELDEILKIGVERDKKKKLQAYQDKLASLRWLDPAAGSGNFLTETYMCIRRLENRVIDALKGGQMTMDLVGVSPIKVQISQFYGIEVNDFAVAVAKTALWIAESQMMHETERLVLMTLDFLPLKTNAQIVEGNALQLDWNRIVNRNDLSYIMGNPPFVGRRYRTKEQQGDVAKFFTYKDVDYVACWYAKAAQYMKDTRIKTAFVSTNSICQGEQVPAIWGNLFRDGISINFAHRTFIWDSEASSKAHVYCIIVGFSFVNEPNKRIYDSEVCLNVDNINGYLIDAPNVVITGRNIPLCDVPRMQNGNVPLDGDALKIEAEDYPQFADCKYVKRLIGGTEMLYNRSRYVLWLAGVSPSEIRADKRILERVELCRKNRLNMKDKSSQKLADRPTEFRDTNNPSRYIAMPIVSGERRRYIPMAYYYADTIPTNQVQIVPDADLYHLGVLTSNVHMSWMRAVCGRLEMRYRYSKDIVYNNFPWPTPSEEQRAKIEQTAKGILDARTLYPDSSLADLYDPLTMPPELRKAHAANDRAVMQAYGFDVKTMTEADCVAALMKMYQELVEKEAEKSASGKKVK